MSTATSVPDLFTRLEDVLATSEPAATLDFLAEEFRRSRSFGLLFDARLMKKRLERGLPLVQVREISDPVYQEAVVAAAREAGTLFLGDGQIDRAWPYFRAIGETEPVAEAIGKIDATAEGDERTDAVIAIAFQEGVHPLKGLEMILARHGMCRAITLFGMQAVTKDREKCIALLANGIRSEIVRRMGGQPEDDLAEMLRHTEPFGEWDSYVDPSHLFSLLPYCTEVRDPATLRMFSTLCDYAARLHPQFCQPGIAPFEDQPAAYRHYVQALAGNDTETHLEYFREQVRTGDPEVSGDAPARVLVQLLVALNRHREALDVVLNSVYEDAPYGTPLPSPVQLAHQAGEYGMLMEIARERGDALSYAAGGILLRLKTR